MNPNQKDGGENDAEDSDVETPGEPTVEPRRSRNLEINVTVAPTKKPKLRRPFDPDDPKTERFLDDPETSVKIFLSSHFLKRGLLWYFTYAANESQLTDLSIGRSSAVLLSRSSFASSFLI